MENSNQFLTIVKQDLLWQQKVYNLTNQNIIKMLSKTYKSLKITIKIRKTKLKN